MWWGERKPMTELKFGKQWDYKKDSELLTCPVCSIQTEFLYGEDTKDGGRKGCENCWKPSPKEGSKDDGTTDTSMG